MTAMMIVTLAAVAVAIATSVIAFRLAREERLRSAARVLALTQLAGEFPDETPDARTARIDFADVEIDPAFEVAGVSELFSEPLPSSAWARRAPIIAGMAVVGLLTVLLFRPSSNAGSTGGMPTGTTAADANRDPKPLELLSLRHTQEGENLTITGLVQNPRGAGPLAKLTATAFLFAADGTFVTSGRAPLDFTTLGPGDESGFVISVPGAANVARYRVGFRDENGRVVSHVDRRTGNGALARND
jgi:hypothetical protein